MIGSVATDHVHSDGRPEFLEQINALFAVQDPSIKVVAPASRMTSDELIQQSGIAWDILGWTLSCHVASVGCGECRGCLKHLEVKAALGIQ